MPIYSIKVSKNTFLSVFLGALICQTLDNKKIQQLGRV